MENAELVQNMLLELRRGTLSIAVLSQLSKEEYGYSLLKALSDQGLEVDQSTLYPLLRRLESQVDTRWSTADLTHHQLPDTTIEPVPVTNLAREPRLCGEVLFVSRPPLPWAWARTGGTATLPTSYARLTVRC